VRGIAPHLPDNKQQQLHLMSDFLKKFKSVFVVEDGSTPAPVQPANASGNNAAPAATAPPATATYSSASSGNVSDKFVEILANALEKNNSEGFDYFEYRQSLRNLANMPMDEQTRFQSAYAMAQTLGVTTPKLIESAKFYLQVLSNEQSKFNEAHAQQKAKLVGNKGDEAKGHEASILQKAEQIKALTQQIEEHRLQADKIKKEIEESTIKIENTKADFEATFQSVSGQIQGDIAKMQQYLK
jgi:hypothetical protein